MCSTRATSSASSEWGQGTLAVPPPVAHEEEAHAVLFLAAVQLVVLCGGAPALLRSRAAASRNLARQYRPAVECIISWLSRSGSHAESLWFPSIPPPRAFSRLPRLSVQQRRRCLLLLVLPPRPSAPISPSSRRRRQQQERRRAALPFGRRRSTCCGATSSLLLCCCLLLSRRRQRRCRRPRRRPSAHRPRTQTTQRP